MASHAIDIDVGGTRVRTTSATLKQLPFLEALMRHDVAGTMKISKNDDGLIFVDRSPELFAKILDGLRTGGQIFAESACEASQLLEELAFFGAQASCPTLSAWENSAMEQVTVKCSKVGRGLTISGCHAVLSEVLPVLGFGSAGHRIHDDFHGHRSCF